MMTHGFDVAVAAVSLAMLIIPVVPVHARRMFAPVRIFRLFSVFPALREIVATFARCGEVIVVLLACLLCLGYSYACIGMETFSSQVTGPRDLCVEYLEAHNTDYDYHVEDYTPSPPPPPPSPSPLPRPPDGLQPPKTLPCLDPIENFEDPWRALLALFQVTTSNNWNAVMYPNVATLSATWGSPGRVCAVLYFVSFYVAAVLILVNILTSLVMEMFGLTWRAQKRRADEEEERARAARAARAARIAARSAAAADRSNNTTREGDVDEDANEGEEDDGSVDASGDDYGGGGGGDEVRTVFVTVDGDYGEGTGEGGEIQREGGGHRERWMVTRHNDWAKDLMLENMCVQTERAALERGLEQLEVQLARRQNERVSAALAQLRLQRENGSDGAVGVRGGSVRGARGASMSLRRRRAGDNNHSAGGGGAEGGRGGEEGAFARDLMLEIQQLSEDDYSHFATLMGHRAR